MIVLRPGHLYELQKFEDKGPYEKPILVQFIEKVPAMQDGGLGAPIPTGELLTVNDGTTNEEVLRMLIDRMNYLQAKFPCRENAIVITKLEESLMWLEKRTAGRTARGVEGKHAK